MTKQEAHAFLNACKAGLSAQEDAITAALVLTGDFTPPAPQKPDFSIQPVASFLNRSGRVMREEVPTA